MRLLPLVLLACAPKVDVGPTLAERLTEPVPMVERHDESALGVYVQVAVHAGSAFDPVGSEGLAALTARALVRGGAGERDARALEAALYRDGIDLDLVIDREWVTLRLGCHPEVAATCVALLGDMLTAPRFETDVVAREVEQARYRLVEGAAEDIEALGAEVLQGWLYEAHPYGHPVDGRAGVIAQLDAEAARGFWRRHYLRGAMTAGIAGRYDEGVRAAFAEVIATVPAAVPGTEDGVPGTGARPVGPPDLVLQQPLPLEGRALLAVQVDGEATGFHLGHTTELTRDHPDYPAVLLAMSWFGAHRQSHGRLFRELREARGLNYGTYAYAEPFVQRGWAAMPEQGVVRRQPHLSLWVRPVTLDNGPFALKLALDELERFVAEGLSEEELEATRAYLTRRLPVEAATVDRRLAYALEAAAAGLPDPNESLAERLAGLDAEAVNAAIARHVHPEDLRIVAISGDAEELVRRLVEESATPIVYAGVEPSADQASRDAEVAEKALSLETHVVSSQGIFR